MSKGVLVVHGPLVLAKPGERIRRNGRSGRGHVLRQELAPEEVVQALALEPGHDARKGKHRPLNRHATCEEAPKDGARTRQG